MNCRTLSTDFQIFLDVMPVPPLFLFAITPAFVFILAHDWGIGGVLSRTEDYDDGIFLHEMFFSINPCKDSWSLIHIDVRCLICLVEYLQDGVPISDHIEV